MLAMIGGTSLLGAEREWLQTVWPILVILGEANPPCKGADACFRAQFRPC